MMSEISLSKAKEILQDPSPEGSIIEITSALKVISNVLSLRQISSTEFTEIARALVDKVAPILASAALESSEKALVSFDGIFMNGNPSISFTELCTGLALGSASAEVVARSLIFFVDKRLGGVERLRAILCSPGSRSYIAALVHLPSRVLNVLNAESMANFNATTVFHEDEYYSTLAEALYLQPTAPDVERDQMLTELLNRMVMMKQTDTLVSCWLAHDNVAVISSLILRAPQTSVQDFVRSLLNTKVNFVMETLRVAMVLQKVLSSSRIALEMCMSALPFERPLLKRPRTGLKRLVTAVKNAGGNPSASRALLMAAEVWCREDFALYGDIQLQRQVTRLLLYYLRQTQNIAENKDINDEDCMMLVLVNGVHLRLSANDARVRRHGMVIGEASSRYYKEDKELTFERKGLTEARQEDARIAGDDRFEDGGDSDFSEIAVKIGKGSSGEEEVDEDSRDMVSAVTMKRDASRKPDVPCGASSEQKAEPGEAEEVGVLKTHIPEELPRVRYDRNVWVPENREDEGLVEDDWSSIATYEMTSSSDEDYENCKEGRAVLRRQQRDYEALRKKIAAPLSVPRMLGLLREINKSDGGALKVDSETAIAALRTLSRRAEDGFTKRHTTLHACATELCMEVIWVDVERYPDVDTEEMQAARKEALQRLLELDFAQVGLALVENIICGQHSDLSRRTESLAALCSGVRGKVERVKKLRFEKEEEKRQNAAQLARIRDEQTVGRVTRRATGSTTRARTVVGWDGSEEEDEGLARVFRALAWGLIGGGGAQFLDITGRDKQLWAQGVVVLSVLAGCAGVSMEGRILRKEVIEIVGRVLKENMKEDAAVRRACALALGGVVEAMSDEEIVQENEMGIDMEDGSVIGEGAEWLGSASIEDIDVGVRRFAGRALRIWTNRWRRAAGD